jgi:hypothetical protein
MEDNNSSSWSRFCIVENCLWKSKNLRTVTALKSHFDTRCPKCLYLMSLPILSSMVQLSKTHEKDGPPTGLSGDPEYETTCPSCHTTWHAVQIQDFMSLMLC